MLYPNTYQALKQAFENGTLQQNCPVWCCNGKTARKPPHLMLLDTLYLYDPKPSKNGRIERESILPDTLIADNEDELWPLYYQQLQNQVKDLIRRAHNVYQVAMQTEQTLNQKGVNYVHTDFMEMLPESCNNSGPGRD
jgi:hypothetical protein